MEKDITIPSLMENLNSGAPLSLSTQEIRDVIALAEEKMMGSNLKIEIPIEHYFSKAVYGREMRVPKGTLLTGKIHKFQNLNILSKGEATVLSIDGVMRIKAPYTFVASPGTKRLIYAHEDTVWTTIHGTDEKNIDKIEDTFIAKNYEDVYLSSPRSLDDVLLALGATPSQLVQISENPDDQIPYSEDCNDIEIKDSPIHGMGVFAKRKFELGDYITMARQNNKRTPAGRYSNHSPTPNAHMYMRDNGDVEVVASQDIQAGEEILTDYYFNYVNTRSPQCHG